ncbi:MAG TPA: sensor histidine kinase [Bryobacteraceae bacterium]|nr:sensor histidine kinase [Bryobacteraceae bacterium]
MATVFAEHLEELATSKPLELGARLLGKNGSNDRFAGGCSPSKEKSRGRKSYMSAREIESRNQEEHVRDERVRREERTRIAQELHDTLLQTFMSASLHLSAALFDLAPDSPVKLRIDKVLHLMRQSIDEGRHAIQGLRSSNGRNIDLLLRLSRVHQELDVAPDVDFRVAVADQPKRLSPEIQYEIYRIGREALVNAFCHSGAKRVELELEYSDSELKMRIRDDGNGIDSNVLENGRDGHWGLAGMQERATRIGGLLKISSSPMVGTEIQLSIPLRSHWVGCQNETSCEKGFVEAGGVLDLGFARDQGTRLAIPISVGRL